MNSDSLASLHIVIPVKPFRLAKSRLAPALHRPLRATLARALLTRTLDVLAQLTPPWPLRITCTVVSRDLMALALARTKGADTLRESGHSLNQALAEGRQRALLQRAAAMLVLPADLPYLAAADIEAMLYLARRSGCVVIAPDRHEHGTNALLLHPPDALHLAFGPHSFDEHCAQAETSNVKLHVYRAPTIAFDLDTPADLAHIGLTIPRTGP